MHYILLGIVTCLDINNMISMADKIRRDLDFWERVLCFVC